jgi:hypothetical protein
MNIYQCSCTLHGFYITAVVVADTKEKALNALQWECDDHIDQTAHKIGTALNPAVRVVCEEGL